MREYEKDLDDNILMRIQHESGVVVTFLTAPPEVFLNQNDLQPDIIWLTDTDVYVLFNEEVLEEYVFECIEQRAASTSDSQIKPTFLQHLIRDSVQMIEKRIY